jgi:hypothetical protein
MAATTPATSRTGLALRRGSAVAAWVVITLLTLRGLGVVPGVVIGGWVLPLIALAAIFWREEHEARWSTKTPAPDADSDAPKAAPVPVAA